MIDSSGDISAVQVGEALAEFMHGAKDGLLGCTGGDVESGGDFCGGALLLMAEDEGGALERCEGAKCAFADAGEFAAQENAFGAGWGSGCARRSCSASSDEAVRSERLRAWSLSSAQRAVMR